MILPGLSIAAAIAAIEYAYRKKLAAAEYTRKMSHVICGFLTWYWSSRLAETEYYYLLAFFLFFFLAERKFRLLHSLHDIGRPSTGILAYLGGLYILGLYYYGQGPFNPGLALMIVPDAVAGTITYTRRLIYKDKLHSACVFYSALIVAVFVFPFIDALILAFVIAVVERYSPYGLDNLTIPAAYVLLMQFS